MDRHSQLLEVLQNYFGFSSFKGDQEAIINSLLDGDDVFVLMPTGGGKSLCYQLPAIILDGVAIVISPLIALMKNQVDAVRTYSEYDNLAHYINSTLSPQELQTVKKDIKSGKTKLLYMAPESLQKKENIDFLHGVKVSFYAIDEAHCISEWGHDFRPEYRNIESMVKSIGSAPKIALTATATPKVQSDIQKNLDMLNAKVFKSSFNRPNLYYEIRPKTDNINKEIIKYIRSREGKSGIVYCLTRKEVESVTALLVANKITALPYHAGLDAATRAANQDAFLMENCQIIVATVAFGMGIDKPDIRFVIHYSIPKSLEGYYQETGRAGRDDGEGQCICYYSAKDIKRLKELNKDLQVAEKEVTNQLLYEMQSYAETTVCRRKFLLNYFGEQYGEEKCGKCDNCKKQYRSVDVTELLYLIMETIEQVNEKFNLEHIVNILRGKETSDILSYKHNKLENFGICKSEEESLLHSVIRHALSQGILHRDAETYGILKITPEGRKFRKRASKMSIPVEIPASDDREDDIEESTMSTGAAVDDVLFSILLDIRKRISRRLDIPPFVIFHDAALEAMATWYPINLNELQNLSGVGVGKAKRYGQEFVDVIKKYVEENEIIRPEDVQVHVETKSSSRKISIIQAIDRRVDLDDIAESKGMSFEELLSEIESIVYSGTRLNISYFIDEIIEQDEQEEIYDYFKNAESDNIRVALKNLGEDTYDERHLRLMRIKFHSDLGN